MNDIFGFLNQMKAFLADRPEWAFLAITLLVCYQLFRSLMNEKDAHLETVKQIVPLADKLVVMLERATKARAQRQPRTPPESGGLPETSGTGG